VKLNIQEPETPMAHQNQCPKRGRRFNSQNELQEHEKRCGQKES